MEHTYQIQVYFMYDGTKDVDKQLVAYTNNENDIERLIKDWLNKHSGKCVVIYFSSRKVPLNEIQLLDQYSSYSYSMYDNYGDFYGFVEEDSAEFKGLPLEYDYRFEEGEYVYGIINSVLMSGIVIAIPMSIDEVNVRFNHVKLDQLDNSYTVVFYDEEYNKCFHQHVKESLLFGDTIEQDEQIKIILYNAKDYHDYE